MSLIGNNWHELGSGITVNNFPAEEYPSAFNPDQSLIRPTSESKQKNEDKIAYIQKGRGRIISACYDLEYVLGLLISDYFLRDNPQKQAIFHELILDTTFLTFAQKKNIARLIIKNSSEETIGKFSEEERKNLFNNLEYVIKMRNALAHGQIIIDLNNDTAFFQYYDSNKNKINKFDITPEFLSRMPSSIEGLANILLCFIQDKILK
ncbi:MAG: hypothetical protein WC626_06980 [Methanoregula sp.]